MNKEIDYQDKSPINIKRIILISLLVSTVSFILMIFMGPIQDTGDDAFTAWQLSRGYGSIASFISPYLSLFFSMLYQILPQIPWWSVCMAFSGWLLLFVGNYFILKQYKDILKYLLCVIWFIVVWLAVVEFLNFTRSGAAYALIGGLLVVDAVLDCNKRKIFRITEFATGNIIFILGSMVRFHSSLLVVPFILLIFAYSCFRKNNYKFKGMFSKNNFKMLFQILMPVIIACLLFASYSLFWNAHPQWKEYNEYNETRSEIIDYKDEYPTWDDAQEQYQKIGFKNEIDVKILFDTVFVGDLEVYNIDKLHSLEQMRLEDEGLMSRVYRMIEKVFVMLKSSQMLLWVIFVVVLLRFYVGKKIWLPSWVSILGAFCILLLFSFSGRIMLRVWEPILLCVVACLFFLFENNNDEDLSRDYSFACIDSRQKIKNKGKTLLKLTCTDKIIFPILCIVLIIGTGIGSSLTDIKVPNKYVDRDVVSRDKAEYINANRDNIYLLSQPLIHHPPNPGVFGLWEPLPSDYYPNYFALNNWDARTPANLNKMKDLGITNPAKSLITRTDTYSNYDSMLLEFLQTHYGERITASAVDRFKDNSAIIQYTAPIESMETNTSDNIKVDITTSQYIEEYGCNALLIKGRLSNINTNDWETLYCNINIEGLIYTYRLSLKSNNGFYGCFYNIPESFNDKVHTATILGKNKNADIITLSTFKID